MKHVRHIREQFLTLKPDEKGMLEIVAAQFVADEPAIFGTPNTDWHERELEWYRSQSLNVFDIPEPVPSTWVKVASRNGFINSNYGWCIWSEQNGFQYKNAISALKKDPYSRQAVMIYTRPSMHSDFNFDGMYDFICTNTVQLLVRNERLHYIVNMRSSDAIFGYKGDAAWHNTVFDMACEDLAVDRGDLIWNAASFHIYPRHKHLVDQYWEEK